MSAEMERLAGLTGVQTTFGKGSELFEELTLSDQSLDKATQAYGKAVEQQETEWKNEASEAEALLRRKREAQPPLRLYGALDGTSVHTRGDGEDGNGDLWRELKLGAWFETESRAPRTPGGEWAIHAKNIRYYADICEAKTFGELLWATGVQHNAHLARELVILGDGAVWIWKLVSEHFPLAIQIVDWFHACEYIEPVAKAVFKDKQARQDWSAQVRTALWDGRLDAVIAACAERVNPKRDNDPAQAAVTYFTNNRHRMDYPTYRAKGYQIGSGTIESAAKQIGLQRMKCLAHAGTWIALAMWLKLVPLFSLVLGILSPLTARNSAGLCLTSRSYTPSWR
jgi:hypothetical protein